MPNSGCSVIGSLGNTSSAAPPTLPDSSARASASWSTSSPRATLMMRTPSLHLRERLGVQPARRLGGLRQVQRDEVGLRVERRRRSRPSRRRARGSARRTRRGRTRPRSCRSDFARSATSWPMRPKPRIAERLLVDLHAAELRALPLPGRKRRSAPAGCCGRARAAAPCVCSAAAIALDSGALATMMPRLVAAGTSTLSTPTPARPITFRRSALLDQVGGELAWPSGSGSRRTRRCATRARRPPSRRRGRPRSARAAGRRRSRRSSP